MPVRRVNKSTQAVSIGRDLIVTYIESNEQKGSSMEERGGWDETESACTGM